MTLGAIAFMDGLGRHKLQITACIWIFVTHIILAGLWWTESH